MIFLDTHVAVWLYEGDLQYIPADVQRRLDQEQLTISPYVRLELNYLFEVEKITVRPAEILADLGRKLELSVADSSVATVCAAAESLGWTRDPFDRLIAAQAVVADMPLITRDRNIRKNLSLAWWGAS